MAGRSGRQVPVEGRQRTPISQRTPIRGPKYEVSFACSPDGALRSPNWSPRVSDLGTECHMNEKLPAPCEHCKGTGLSHGSECRECRGKGYRLTVKGVPLPMPKADKPHRWRDARMKRR